MRSLGQLLTALRADALPNAAGVVIRKSASILAGPPGWEFVAEYNGVTLAITPDEKGTLEDAGATFDKSRLHP